MSNKPFKLKGHTLPGPNQRSTLKESPVKFFGIIQKLFGGGKKTSKSKGIEIGENYEGGESYSDISDGGGGGDQNTGFATAQKIAAGGDFGRLVGRDQLTENRGGEDYSAFTETAPIDTGVDDDSSTKKSVDVEVTVNGEKI